MESLLELMVGAAAMLLLIPASTLCAEVLAAIAHPRRVAPEAPEGARPRVAVLMPAHDEAVILAQTLRAIIPQLGSGDRLLVVADNCTDATAAIAGAEGAEVVSRTDMLRRGKGYALDFGLRHLASEASAPPDIVLIADADCRLNADSIDRLARACARSARPVQALYLMHAGPGARLGMRIAEFAWVLKNQIRPTGLHRLGLPCQLMGTGMAFPWRSISSMELATGHIVEDLKLGIDFALAGSPPLFCPGALVTSDFPASIEGIQSQRTRWEHGHLSVILSEAPRLLWNAVTSQNIDSLAMALDISIPPLALLLLMVSATWAAALGLFIFGGSSFPLITASVVCAFFAFAVLMSWHRYGRHILSLGSLALAVLRAAMKIPLYFRFIFARQSQWIRSKRDRDPR